MYLDDESIVKHIVLNHQNEDWDKVPDPDVLQDVFVIYGKRLRIKDDGPYVGNNVIDFAIDGEFATIEEAQAQIEKCKSWEGVIVGSLRVVNHKPSHAIWMWYLKHEIKRIADKI